METEIMIKRGDIL